MRVIALLLTLVVAAPVVTHVRARGEQRPARVEKLKTAFDAIDKAFVDFTTREHIPGAISLPHRTMDPDTTSRLDRDALLVAYCDGIGCNASARGALALLRLGFRVKELIGGLDWWKRDGHPTHGEALQASEASAQRAEGERSHQAGAALACGC